jgi:sugar phosphate isomerase/epimerase
MRINQSPLHLTYCSNIHPGESWGEVLANLKTYLPGLKAQLSPDRPFGIGLRLANIASEEILVGNHLAEFKQWLASQDLYVFTLNGFPYGSFHRQVVKDQVYAPDWFTADRLTYTQRLIQILAALLPAGMNGSISTLPISYKPWHTEPATLDAQCIEAARSLSQLADELQQLEKTTGQYIHLGLEPEPDGLIENTDEVITWFDRYLPTPTQRRYIQVCYDTCHFAVEFESPEIALDRLKQASIGISKIQLSSALRIPVPLEQADRLRIQQALTSFAESTYLHQVVAQDAEGNLVQYRDLGPALEHWLDTRAIEWRTHFHVPLFVRDYAIASGLTLSSTQADIQATLQYLAQHPQTCQHLEIETYTWEVLPPEMKLDMATSIQREYEWVLKEIC